jgi:phosphate transport system permease protein
MKENKLQGINQNTWKQKWASYKRNPFSLFLFILVLLATSITILTMTFLVGYILIKGIPYVTPDIFSWNYTSDNVSFMPAIVNTLILVLGALLLAAPLGICAAIYLVEYAKRGNKIVSIVRVTAETLSGIPSIVFGLFGMLFFVTALQFGYSLLAGIFTVAIMILPLIMRTTEEALKSVPDTYREGSFGLGAGKLRTVSCIVLPAAVPGILAGIILAIGRVVGETAALVYTAGTVAEFPKSIFSSGRSLSVHMYALSKEGLHTDQAYATAVMLLLVVLFINWFSTKMASKITRK